MDKNIFNRKDKDLQLRANDGRIPLEGDRPVSKKKIVARGPIPTQEEKKEMTIGRNVEKKEVFPD